MDIIEILRSPWPWYISGPLIGLSVPLLLIFGNKAFGLSSTFRHMCAMVDPFKIEFFQYNWRKEMWNMTVVAGIILGGYITSTYLQPSVTLSTQTIEDLKQYQLIEQTNNSLQLTQLQPEAIFSVSKIGELRTIIMVILGGFLVGFGTRYANGCTSGHAITGLSTFNWSSIFAIIGFFIGGLTMTWFILPYILKLT